MADHLTLYIYKYNDTTKLWEWDTDNYILWVPRPSGANVTRQVAWRSRSTGTKQLKVFKWKGRQSESLTLTGRVGALLWAKLEFLAVSKLVVDIYGDYTQPGGSQGKYPMITPIGAYPDEVGTIPDLTSTTTSPNHLSNAFYICTGITGTMRDYAVGEHPDGTATKREVMIDVNMKFERVDKTKITATWPYS